MKPQKISTEKVFSGRIVHLDIDTVRLEDGREVKREIVHHADAVCIFAYDGENGYLVRQYRHPTGDYLTEAVAGLIDPGETPEEAAVRELNEETDFLCEKLEPLGQVYTSPGFTDEIIWLFAANITGTKKGIPDEDEFIDVLKFPLTQIKTMAEDGTLTDAKTVAVILRFFAVHGNR